MTTASAEHLARLPKCELHCHVEGSVRAATVRDLATTHGVPFPVDDPEDLYHYTDLNQFLGVFGVVCTTLQGPDDFRRIAYESLEDAAACGVRYREMFFSPGFHIDRGLDIAAVFAGLVVGVREAESDLDITCRLILDVDKPRLGTHAMEMVELAGTLDRDMLIGVGGDSTERGVDHRVFVPAWQRAAELGLRRTFHAGEDGPVENIRIAVDEMGCERIDHGTVLLDDPDLTRRVADRGIPVTSCPGSNVALHVVEDLQAHPFARQRAQGVLLSINGDDPTMFGITPASEYADVAEAFGFDLGTMEDIALDTITSTFLDDADRAALRTRFLADFDVLRAEYGHPARA